MAKKKSKVASNRGYATTSAPSKKIEPTPKAVEVVAETASPAHEPENPFQDILTPAADTAPPTTAAPTAEPATDKAEDPVLKLMKKYESLNDHKAQVALERLFKEDPQLQQLPPDRLKKFRLTAELERELLQVIKHKNGDIFGKGFYLSDGSWIQRWSDTYGREIRPACPEQCKRVREGKGRQPIWRLVSSAD